MFKTIASFVARITARPASPRGRVIWLVIGTVLFLVVIPAVLLLFARSLTARFRAGRRDAVRLAAGIPAVALGLGTVAWSAATFWSRGEGTPAPPAAPRRLVTGGPFRYCRNPIQLGATLYYFGIGCLAESFGAGLVMLALTSVFGTAWHRLVEEKELRMRFGEEYETYRRNTPYIIPRFCAFHRLFSTTKMEQERKS
jgi:protein-S-isoprenylcysteine O-methyltransferase Ste14